MPIEGWSVGRATKVSEIHVTSEQTLLARCRPSKVRPDVAEYLNHTPEAGRSGFRICVDVSRDSNEALKVWAVLANGERIPIGEVYVKRFWRTSAHPAEHGVVSIIIPCYNHADFLDDAIQSCLAQTYPKLEVIVIDDGSTDNCPEVVRRYPSVRYVWQPNLGLAAARNSGIRHSNGEYLVFLDADDRLVAEAARRGVSVMEAFPEAALASGEHCLIGIDGTRMAEWTRAVVTEDHYLALLKGNYVGCPAAAMYRRAVFRLVGGFDQGHVACEDYDMYLRIARQFPVRAHGELVAEYRRSGGSMSDDPARMLSGSRAVLHAQWPHAKRTARTRRAWIEGARYWNDYYGPSLAEQTRTQIRTSGRRRNAIRGLWHLARYAPRHLATVFS